MTAYKRWLMAEFTASSADVVEQPFWDVAAYARFTHQADGETQTVKGFYDGVDRNGEHTWKFRWTPPRSGDWECRIEATPRLAGIASTQLVMVEESDSESRGFMRAVAGRTWGFEFDNGESFFPLGDTIYNLFGGMHCGIDVEAILAHRQAQGVNYVRARMQVSPYHKPIANDWQTRDCWPWLGSPQWPDFRGFNLDYFRSVDKAMELLDRLGIGVELILEAWMLEFPFNDRNRFLTEHEEHWIDYIVARYAAYPCMYVWCPANEYDLYPGRTDKAYVPEASRWLKRLAGQIKRSDPYLHPVGAHQWVQESSLHERIGDCADIDIYLVQSDWFLEFMKYNRQLSLCLWIEDALRFHAPDRSKAVMCSEFGYERASKENYTMAAHDMMDEHHTRRGMWKAGFVGFPIVHGFNNTWGPHLTLEHDSVGASYLLPYYRFMTEVCPYAKLSPRPELPVSDEGMLALESPALCLADDDLSQVTVYLPVGGTVTMKLPEQREYVHFWYNPRTGEQSPPAIVQDKVFASPERIELQELGSDWTLVLTAKA